MTDERAAHRLFRKAGGKSPFREMTGLPRSRVDSMDKTGNVPESLRVQVYVALRKAGVDVTPLDFVPELLALPATPEVQPHAG